MHLQVHAQVHLRAHLHVDVGADEGVRALANRCLGFASRRFQDPAAEAD